MPPSLAHQDIFLLQQLPLTRSAVLFVWVQKHFITWMHPLICTFTDSHWIQVKVT